MEVKTSAYRKKDKNGKRHWTARVTLPGGQRRECRSTSKLEALKLAETMRATYLNVHHIGTASIGALANRYLDDLREREKEGQITGRYFQDCRRNIVEAVNAIGPQRTALKVTKLEIKDHLRSVATTKSANSANVAMTHLRAFMNWAFNELDFPRDWLRFPPKFRRSTPVSRPVYTIDEFWTLIDAATPRLKVLLFAYLETAARQNELLSLTWDKVDLASRTITLTTGKRKNGTEQDVIQISEELAKELRGIRIRNMHTKYVHLNNNKYVFLSEDGEPYGRTTRVLKWLCKRAGVPYKGFHGLRRLSATLDPESAYMRLRHQLKTTTDNYLFALRKGSAVDVLGIARGQQKMAHGD